MVTNHPTKRGPEIRGFFVSLKMDELFVFDAGALIDLGVTPGAIDNFKKNSQPDPDAAHLAITALEDDNTAVYIQAIPWGAAKHKLPD